MLLSFQIDSISSTFRSRSGFKTDGLGGRNSKMRKAAPQPQKAPFISLTLSLVSKNWPRHQNFNKVIGWHEALKFLLVA